MACQRYAGAVRACAAGAELAPEVRAHVDRCDDCRRELAREQRLLADIASDLSGAMRIEPSVEFEARVRERIADVGSGFSRISRWQFALAGASLVVVAVAVTLVVHRAGTPGPTPAATSPRPATQASIANERPATSAEGRETRDHGRGTRDEGRETTVARGLPNAGYRAPAPREPEVLVPPDQRVALDKLIALIRAGKIDEKMFPHQQDAAATPEQVVAPIIVEELKVPPINVPPAAGTTEKR